MNVNIAVSGRFHFHNYVSYIHQRGILNQFYFSHKRSSGARLDIPRDRYANLWLKEYLTQGHSRLIGGFARERAFEVYGNIWSVNVLARWKPADLLHAMAHGFALPLMHRARRDGSLIVAEAVNTHPANQNMILDEEAARWGLRSPGPRLSRVQQTIVRELAIADRVLVPTEVVKLSMINHGIPSEKIVKIPYAANIVRFRPSPDRRHYAGRVPLRLVCVGTVGLRKGQLHLLEAVRKLGPGIVDLTLVGAIDPQISGLLGRYAQSFTHVAQVPNAEMPSFLASHDAFALVSREEGLAVSTCEAMAMGLPILATRESGAEELFQDGEAGFLVPAGSSDAIAARIQQWYSDPDIVRHQGSAALAQTRSDHNWERYSTALAHAYHAM